MFSSDWLRRRSSNVEITPVTTSSSPSKVKPLIIGSIAGMTGGAVAHPFDLIKVRLQVRLLFALARSNSPPPPPPTDVVGGLWWGIILSTFYSNFKKQNITAPSSSSLTSVAARRAG
jgi:hypothetical protein